MQRVHKKINDESRMYTNSLTSIKQCIRSRNVLQCHKSFLSGLADYYIPTPYNEQRIIILTATMYDNIILTIKTKLPDSGNYHS